MACLDACKPEPILRVAALLHDVAKPRTRAFSDKTQDYTFYEHERIGAEIAAPIVARLRFSNEERERIVALVRHHLFHYTAEWSDATVRRWIRRVGRERARSGRFLHLDGGDCFQGAPVFNFYRGEAEIRALSACSVRASRRLGCLISPARDSSVSRSP